MTDGIDFINIYSKGQTEIGRALSNFYTCPFNHPKYGQFNTIEGLWFYILSGNERLRFLEGYECKMVGKTLENSDYPETFIEDITTGLDLKFINSGYIRNYFANNKPLPLKHFYVKNGQIISLERHNWLVDYWQKKWDNTFKEFQEAE